MMDTDCRLPHNSPATPSPTSAGFSLVEILVAMALFIFLISGILKAFIQQHSTSTVQYEVAYAQQSVRAAMDLMTREIRNAGYDPLDNDFEAIPTATSTQIRLLANTSGDDEASDDPSEENEDVTYTINGSNQLTRNGIALIDYVDNFQLGYVLSDGTTLNPPGAALTAAQRAEIRDVIVTLGVRTENPDATGSYRTRTLVTRTRVRNLGFQDQE